MNTKKLCREWEKY